MEGNYLLLFAVFYPILGALAVYLIGRKKKNIRDRAAQFIPASEIVLFLLLYFLPETFGGTTAAVPQFCGFGLHFTLDGFRIVHVLLASAMWFMTTVFAKEYLERDRNRNRYYLFTLLTLGATLGVFLSADLYTTFIFFEMMSFTSFVWVMQNETKEAAYAAKTYLAVGVAAGLVMLMGLFLLESAGNIYIAGFCLLTGFGAKAGMFALHIWLPGSYTQAPAPASALLSGMLSKTGIYGIIVVTASMFVGDVFWGKSLVVFGLLTMITGAVLALFSINLKRTLACSSMSQIGFILTGVGMFAMLGEEGGIAAAGTALHMVNHSLIKLILFVAAGVIFMNVGNLDLNKIRGYGRRKPLLKTVFLSAALGIAGIPLFNGYISKTLLHESIIEGMNLNLLSGGFLQIAEWIFLLSGGFTVAYMAKIFIAVFVEENADKEVQKGFDEKKPYLSKITAGMLSVTAILLPVLGAFPTVTSNRLAALMQGIFGLEETGAAIEVSYFGWESLKGGIVSVLIGVLLYMFAVKKYMMSEENETKVYTERFPKWLNLGRKIYQPLFMKVLPSVFGFLSRICDSFMDSIIVLLRKTILKDSKLPFELEEGTRMTYHAGQLLNECAAVKRRKAEIKEPSEKVDYIHKLAVKYEEMVEDRVIIGRSLSFGLLLFCLGLCATLIYIVFL